MTVYLCSNRTKKVPSILFLKREPRHPQTERCLFFKALCQLLWVDEKLSSREYQIDTLFFKVQSNQNTFLKVFKVPKSKSSSFNIFYEFVSSF